MDPKLKADDDAGASFPPSEKAGAGLASVFSFGFTAGELTPNPPNADVVNAALLSLSFAAEAPNAVALPLDDFGKLNTLVFGAAAAVDVVAGFASAAGAPRLGRCGALPTPTLGFVGWEFVQAWQAPPSVPWLLRA